MDAGRRTRKANAYFTGFGTHQANRSSYDTLLTGTNPDEVELVVAHEIATGGGRTSGRGSA